jgi:hypothetical protein
MGFVVRLSAGALAVLSLAINYLSVRVQYEQWLVALETPATMARVGLHTLTPGQQADDYYNHFSTGPIWGDVTLLRHDLAPMAFDWWAHGRWYVGTFFVIVAAACLVGAVLLGCTRLAEGDRAGELAATRDG